MTARDCERFEQWLDNGDPAHAAVMRAHAARCSRCGPALAAMEEIDVLMSAPPVAPPGFTDAVMRRIERPVPARAPLDGDDAPWWMGVLIQPSTVLASVVAALVMWQGRSLLAAGALLADKLVGWTAGLGSVLPATIPVTLGRGSIDLAWLAVALGLAPVVAFGSFALASGVTRWVTHHIARA